MTLASDMRELSLQKIKEQEAEDAKIDYSRFIDDIFSIVKRYASAGSFRVRIHWRDIFDLCVAYNIPHRLSCVAMERAAIKLREAGFKVRALENPRLGNGDSFVISWFPINDSKSWWQKIKDWVG